MPDNTISSLDELLEIYDAVNPVSISKETEHLTDSYKNWLEKSSFFALATSGSAGLDCSPRGDAQKHAFHILDDKTILIPDRRGNNRLDSLKNIIEDPRVALLFLIPGINETLRINGNACLSTAPELLQLFPMQGTLPKSVIKISINAVYFQCARALIRSDLWNPEQQLSKGDVPSAGEMTKSALADFDATSYDEALPERQSKTLY